MSPFVLHPPATGPGAPLHAQATHGESCRHLWRPLPPFLLARSGFGLYFKLLCHASFDGCGVNTDPTGYGIAQGERKEEETLSAVSHSKDWYIFPCSAAEESEADEADLEPRCSRMQHQEVKLVPVATHSSSFLLCSSPRLLQHFATSPLVSPPAGRQAGIRSISSLGKQIRFSIIKKAAV